MNEIIINNNGGTLTVPSMQIAENFGKRHCDVIRDIENIKGETSTQNCVNLFIESTYADSYGRQQKCYDLTRDGFSLLVMGFTGKKALEWKLKYIEAFNLMETKLKKGFTELEQMKIKAQYERATAMRMNAENRRLKLLLSNPNWKSLSDVALQTMGIKAVETVTGQDLSPLLPQCDKLYSATEVAKILGIMTNDGKKPSANKIGTMSNKLKLKEADENNNSQYGVWVMDKSRSSDKEMSNFKYNAKGVQVLAEAFGVKDYKIS